MGARPLAPRRVPPLFKYWFFWVLAVPSFGDMMLADRPISCGSRRLRRVRVGGGLPACAGLVCVPRDIALVFSSKQSFFSSARCLHWPWWTCYIVVVNGDLFQLGRHQRAISPTHHRRVGLPAHPSALASTPLHGVALATTSNDPSTARSPWIKPVQERVVNERSVLQGCLRVDRAWTSCHCPPARLTVVLLTPPPPSYRPMTSIISHPAINPDLAPPHSCSAVVAHSSLHSTTHTERSLAPPPSRGGAMQRERQELRHRR